MKDILFWLLIVFIIIVMGIGGFYIDYKMDSFYHEIREGK